jgi:hypothetical protein
MEEESLQFHLRTWNFESLKGVLEKGAVGRGVDA